jgi:HSP20 family molecular chaperone IbpA
MPSIYRCSIFLNNVRRSPVSSDEEFNLTGAHNCCGTVGRLFREEINPSVPGVLWNWRHDLVPSEQNMNIRAFRFRHVVIAVASLLAINTACAKSSNSVGSTPPVSSTSASGSAPAVPTISPLATASPFADVQIRMRDLQSQLDNVFADTFRDFGSDFGQTGFASSVDLREQKDRYVARIYLPNGDTSKVKATMNGNDLKITMDGAETKNGAAASEKYQQVISLPEPVRADQLQIKRKPNMVVISVPKSAPSKVAATSAQRPAPGGVGASPTFDTAWDQRMIDDMRQMEARMNTMIQNAFPNDFWNGSTPLEVGSTVNVDDQKDKYVVHFALPNHDVSNVNVNFENGELHLSAQENKSNSTKSQQSIERGRYEEMVTLPGPVKGSEMKVNRQANAVVVTLPKA